MSESLIRKIQIPIHLILVVRNSFRFGRHFGNLISEANFGAYDFAAKLVQNTTKLVQIRIASNFGKGKL